MPTQNGSEKPAKKRKVHKRKLKKMLAKPTININKVPISLTLIRKLVLQVAQPHGKKQQEHFEVLNADKVANIVVCVVPGLLEEEFRERGLDTLMTLENAEKQRQLLFFDGKFSSLIPMTNPGSSSEVAPVLPALFGDRILKSVKEKLLEELRLKQIGIEDLLVKDPDWVDHNYKYFPGSGETAPEGWFQTKDLHKDKVDVFSLDCEFCQTESGNQLARISVVNYEGKVVYDEVVKPKDEITNYATRYSGMTKEVLDKATTTEDDVREKLKLLISASDIVVGHSLLSDFNVLKMVHGKVVDTCVIYDHHRKKPYKASLKWLCEKYLNRQIQQGEEIGQGHSSIENAVACLDLVKLKLSNGMHFGQEPDFLPISAVIRSSTGHKTSILDTLMTEWKVPGCFLDTVTHVAASNDDEVAAKVKATLGESKIIFAKFSQFPKGALSEQKQRLSEQLDDVWTSVPEYSLFIVLGGSADKPEIQKLSCVKRQFNKKQKQGEKVTSPDEVWDFDKESQLKRAVAEARRSLAFVAIKPSQEESDEQKGHES